MIHTKIVYLILAHLCIPPPLPFLEGTSRPRATVSYQGWCSPHEWKSLLNTPETKKGDINLLSPVQKTLVTADVWTPAGMERGSPLRTDLFLVPSCWKLCNAKYSHFRLVCSYVVSREGSDSYPNDMEAFAYGGLIASENVVDRCRFSTFELRVTLGILCKRVNRPFLHMFNS